MALVEILGRLALDRRPRAAVPQHHRAAAVFAGGDGAFEGGVAERVVLGADGEALLVGVEAGAAGDGPAFQNAVDFEAEIPVETGGVVLLDHEAVAVAGGQRARGFGGLGEVPLRIIEG